MKTIFFNINNTNVYIYIFQINKYFIDTENLVDINEIEKYETSSRFLVVNELNNVDITTLLAEDCIHNDNTDDDLAVTSITCSEEAERMKIISYALDDTSEETSELEKKPNKSNCTFKKKYRTRKSVLAPIEESEKIAVIENTDENDVKLAIKKVRYWCEPCSKYFWEKKKYEGHMKQVHEGVKRPFQCSQCDKAYNLYKTLLQHKRECHSEKSQEIFKCSQCLKMFKTAVILKQHVTNKHSAEKESMRSICDQCGFIAAHQYSLARHIINKHTETDQIKCDQCPKVFKTRYSLKYHKLGNHNPSNIKPFKCAECQMGFTRKTLLNQHKRTHLKYTERIKCDFEGCEVRFVKHGDKTHHMRLVHLKVKQHICDFCGEAFGAMQTLRHHRFIHTGEKPYKCNICGQGFRQRTAMKTHRKTHFGKDTEHQDVINNLPEMNLSLINKIN